MTNKFSTYIIVTISKLRDLWKNPESCDNFVDSKLFFFVQFAESFAPVCIWTLLSGKVLLMN